MRERHLVRPRVGWVEMRRHKVRRGARGYRARDEGVEPGQLGGGRPANLKRSARLLDPFPGVGEQVNVPGALVPCSISI